MEIENNYNNQWIRDSHFQNMKIEWANFSKCILVNCDFSNVILNYAIMYSINATNCCFDKADLLGSILNSSIFENCSFKRTFLAFTNLVSCQFINCNLEGASFDFSNLWRVEFIRCRNLPKYVHEIKSIFQIKIIDDDFSEMWHIYPKIEMKNGLYGVEINNSKESIQN